MSGDRIPKYICILNHTSAVLAELHFFWQFEYNPLHVVNLYRCYSVYNIFLVSLSFQIFSLGTPLSPPRTSWSVKSFLLYSESDQEICHHL